jgi:hypothetical protein
MATLDYLLVAGAGLTIFLGIMLLLERVLIASMALKSLLYALPFG